MESFQNSYLAKQEARKHPNIYAESSSSENEDNDFENIKMLAKLDAGLNLKDKKYDYHRKENGNGSGSQEKVDDQSVKSGSANGDLNETSDEGNDENDGWSITTGSTNKNSNDDSNNDGDDFSEVDENISSNDVDKSHAVNESNFNINMDNNLESTEQLPSPTNGYDFHEDRRVVRLEKLLTYACQELELIKADVKDIKRKSGESETVVQNMASVCKDLSVEVFACTAEIKKRNGLFTDVLVPDIKLPIKRTKQYGDVELTLRRHKVVDNLVSMSYLNKDFRNIPNVYIHIILPKY